MPRPDKAATGPFNPAMLQLARSARSVTQEEVARTSGVTQALLSKIENRLIETPSAEVVDALARALGFPTSFFFQRDDVIGLSHFHHRKRAKLGAKPLARIHAVTNIRRMHIQRLISSWEKEALKPIPQIDLDDVRLTPAQLAARMREYWTLPRGPVSCLSSIIEAAGGIIVLSDFGTGLLDGISFRLPGLPPLFFMNSQVPGDRFRFSLAHELGHMIMHGMPDDDEKMERQADEFAAAFLMPAQDIRPYLSSVSLSKLGRVKPLWRVSIKSLIRRSHDLRLITSNQYKLLNIEYNKARYGGGEPHPIDVEKSTLLARLVEHHLNGLGYSTDELAQLLCIGENDFRRAYLPAPASGLRLVVSNDT